MSDCRETPLAWLKRWLPLLSGLALAACSAAKAPPPAPTEVGTSTGAPVRATIGAAGGTLASAGGRLTLTVPAGALSADTALALEPIANFAPGGMGDAFRLTPDGQQFASPVTITFGYADADFAGSAVEALAIAYQDAKGYWVRLEPTLDRAAHTVSVQTTHFTDYAIYQELRLSPASARVHTGKQQQLTAEYCHPEEVAGEDGTLHSLVAPCSSAETDQFLRNWSVNGVVGGDSSHGQIGAGNPATFTAPAKKPSPNAVAVSVDVQIPIFKFKVVLVSSVTVTDDTLSSYTGTVTVNGVKHDGGGTRTTTFHGKATVTLRQSNSNTQSANYELDVPSVGIIFDQFDMSEPSRTCGLTADATTVVPSSVAPPYLSLGVSKGGGTYGLQGFIYASGNWQCTPTSGAPYTEPAAAAAFLGSATAGNGTGQVPFTDVNHLTGNATLLGANNDTTTTTWDLTGN